METPKRNLRIEDTLWFRAIERARQDETTLSDVVRACLKAYVEGDLVTPPTQRQIDRLRAAISELIAVLEFFESRALQEPKTSAFEVGSISEALNYLRHNMYSVL